MSRLFTAGAEAGTTDVWTAIWGATVSTVQKRTGAYSFYLSAGDYSTKFLWATDPTVLYFRFGIRPTGFYGGWRVILLLENAGAGQCYLGADVTGTLSVYRVGSGTPLATAVHPLAVNAWQCVEWYIKIGTGTDGETTLKIDGATEILETGLNTQGSGIAGARGFGLGYILWGGYSQAGYYDDIAVNDNAGAVNNSWIGRGGIYPVFPEGVGAYTDLHAFGHANPWDCISEVPPDDADYVYDDTVDQKSVYAMSALVPTTGTIACINVIMRAKLDAAGTGNIARLIRSNGVDSQGADVGLDTSPKTIQENIETDPSGGGAWTIARVNALEAGATVR